MTAADRTAPFRVAPRLLACPRCGENLERVMNGVQVCGRCEGVWLAALAIKTAFETAHWPHGASAWWRRSLECPVCSLEGAGSVMTAVHVRDLFVDRCSEHGVWLDSGELGRLLDMPRTIELEAFHERLAPGTELPPQLRAFRAARGAELERRARELEAYRKRVEAELAAQRAAEHAAREAERARIEGEAARAREQELRRKRATLERLRAAAEADVDAITDEVRDLRTRLHAAEGKLADARGRVLEVDRQLDVLDRSPGR